MKLALFPLPIFLLPGGKTRLRIFEPRYVRMVSDSLKSGEGFGICSFADKQKVDLLSSGTRVKVYDFETLEDGTLGISVEGCDRFTISDFDVEKDGLRIGEVHFCENWPPQIITPEYQFIADSLDSLIQEHPLYSADELNNRLSDLTWICQRWLELLPVPTDKKQQIISQVNFETLRDLIIDIIQSKDDPDIIATRNPN